MTTAAPPCSPRALTAEQREAYRAILDDEQDAAFDALTAEVREGMRARRRSRG